MTDGVDDNLSSPKDAEAPAADMNAVPLDIPATLSDAREVTSAKVIAESGFFDAAWYSAAHPEVLSSGLSPVLHYVRHGAATAWSPGPRFDATAYLEKYKDVRKTGMNPLLHYLQFGRAEGRAISAVAKPPELQPVTVEATPPKPDTVNRDETNARLIAESGFFDAEWYVAKHPDVATSGLTPALHFIKLGGASGWPPGPGFDAADYLARHKDVRQTGMNPLVHYISFGRNEARLVKPADADEVHARLIIRSGLFDATWYKAAYPEVAKSRLQPLRYFLKHGREKGHNPGPAFDSQQYIGANRDVQSSKINPLLHYLQFGRAEGRAISAVRPKPQAVAEAAPASQAKAQAKDPQDFAADVALIEQSPLFDKAWYFNRYPDIAKHGMAAAEHYLRFGASELRQPSIYFDPQYYVIEQSPEIQQTGINPLLHFLKTGRSLGRKPRALFEFVPAPPRSNLLDWSVPVIDVPAHENSLPWVRQAELERQPGLFSISIGNTVIASASEDTALRTGLTRIVAFMSMMGLDQRHDLSIAASGANGLKREAVFRPVAYTCLGPELARGAARLIDAWFANELTLRVRAGDEAVVKRKPMVVRAFQCGVPGTAELSMCAEVLLGEQGPDFFDLKLDSALLPVLIVLAEPDGNAIEIGLLPFPSLCRGGLHHSELLGTVHVSNPVEQLRSLSDRFVKDVMLRAEPARQRLISDIAVQVKGAAGIEPVFSPAMLNWITGLFGVTVSASVDSGTATPGELHLRDALVVASSGKQRRDGQFSLILPPDAIPTIAALTATGLNGPHECCRCTGPYFVADAVTSRPRLSVVLPPMDADLLALRTPDTVMPYPVLMPNAEPQDLVQEQRPIATTVHLAIRFTAGPETHRAMMLMPHAPDHHDRLLNFVGDAVEGAVQRVDAIIRASNPRYLETLLSSLLNQRGVAIGEVLVEGSMGSLDAQSFQAVLDRVIPGRGRLLQARPLGGLPARIAGSQSRFTIHAEDTMVLHDARTVETLLTMLGTARTATASCVIVREQALRKGSLLNFESGGYFPSHVSLLSAPRLILGLPDCRDALSGMTYPVIANDPGFLVMRNDAADEGTFDGIAYALRAVAAGYRHLCTSVVRATSLKAESRREISDPPGIDILGDHQWEPVLSSVTLVRGLN